jgi:hypothetical protein
MRNTKSQHERWESETKFFDEFAKKAEQTIRPTDPLTRRRYSSALRKRFNKEFPLHVDKRL